MDWDSPKDDVIPVRVLVGVRFRVWVPWNQKGKDEEKRRSRTGGSSVRNDCLGLFVTVIVTLLDSKLRP